MVLHPAGGAELDLIYDPITASLCFPVAMVCYTRDAFYGQ